MSEEAIQNRKYAKWKAAYIHNCLKNGETPHAGPLPEENDGLQDNVASGGDEQQPGSSSNFGWNNNIAQQPPYQPLDPSFYQPPTPAQNFQPDEPTSGSNINLPFNLPDPPKDPEPKNPGGFVPYNPSTSNIPSLQPTQTGSSLLPEQIAKAQKYCKYVASALTYDDVPTAIDNLQKCLRLLQTGQDS